MPMHLYLFIFLHVFDNSVFLRSDITETGNKRIVLKDWEKQLLKLMQGEDDPTIVAIKGYFLLFLSSQDVVISTPS